MGLVAGLAVAALAVPMFDFDGFRYSNDRCVTLWRTIFRGGGKVMRNRSVASVLCLAMIRITDDVQKDLQNFVKTNIIKNNL